MKLFVNSQKFAGNNENESSYWFLYLKFGFLSLNGCLILLVIFQHFNFLQNLGPHSLPGLSPLGLSIPKYENLYIQLTKIVSSFMIWTFSNIIFHFYQFNCRRQYIEIIFRNVVFVFSPEYLIYITKKCYCRTMASSVQR